MPASPTLARRLDSARGPRRLVLVRHAESLSNVAEEDARRRDAERVLSDTRDADVPLTDLGRQQAAFLAEQLRSCPDTVHPTTVLCSPFLRARQTAEPLCDAVGVPLVLDERLRERDVGLHQGLTDKGLRALDALESERRDRIGKFLHTPPAGESIADVVLRVRSLMADLREACDGEVVWLVTHQAVVMAIRYVLEGLDEASYLALDAEHTVANASVTVHRRGDQGYDLVAFNSTEPLSDLPVAH